MNLGIFDSGVGGLTVLKEIIKNNTFDKVIYYADTKRLPYGDKDKQTLIQYAKDDIEFLLNKGADQVIVACGTISSNVLDDIKNCYNIRIEGIIDVACKEVARVTENNKVGVIATPATIRTHAYANKIKELKNIEVFEVACPEFTPLIEAGKIDSTEMEDAIKEYIIPLSKEDIDTLVFGCTHYPLLQNKIEKIFNKKINFINSGVLLDKEFNVGSYKKPDVEYYASGDLEDFNSKLKTII